MNRFLILRSDERTSQLQPRLQEIEKGLLEAEEGGGVEGRGSAGCQQHVRAAEAIAARDFPGLPVPEEEMEVACIEGIKVERLPGALADGAEGYFPQAADFMQHAGDLPSGGEEYVELALGGEGTAAVQVRDLGEHFHRIGRLRDGLE